MSIPWNAPVFSGRECELVKQVLASGRVSEGPMTNALEERLKKVVNAKHVIMTTSCTAALYLAIEADKRIRNYTERDVVLPNLTFLATRQAVEQAGLITKIVDVTENRYLLNENNYIGLIGELPKIILGVNLLGRKMGGYELDHKQFTYIYDNAGCLGSDVPNGKVGCYSLQANKLLSSGGQGGFCATDDDEYAKVIRQLKDFGRESKEDQHTKGFNFKFNDIQAAVALGQLDMLEDRKKLHSQQYSLYKNQLEIFGKFIEYQSGEIPLWVEFITDKRDELFKYLKSKGIETRKPWVPLVDNPELYPNTDYYTKNCLWLPNGPSLTIEQQEEVIQEIKNFYTSLPVKSDSESQKLGLFPEVHQDVGIGKEVIL